MHLRLSYGGVCVCVCMCACAMAMNIMAIKYIRIKLMYPIHPFGGAQYDYNMGKKAFQIKCQKKRNKE